MNIKNLTGYMLGNSNKVMCPKEQWCATQVPVWVCRDLNVARDVLRNSQKNMGLFSPVWTTIYRVHGTDVPCERVDAQFFYTSRPDKIIVSSVVCYQEPEYISEEQLLANARRNRSNYMRLMNGALYGKTKGEK